MPDLKVTADHLRRDAYLYIRQSTLRQVAENGESTQRQYGLRHRAIAAGWPDERIHVIDCDLGKSGSSVVARDGFQQLVSEVALAKAGVVMGLEVSRLARNSADWHRCNGRNCVVSQCGSHGHTWGFEPVFEASDEQIRDARNKNTHHVLDRILLSVIADRRPLDLLHIDIQGGEAVYVAGCLEDMDNYVRRTLIDTHSRVIEGTIMKTMFDAGWMLEMERPAIFSLEDPAQPTMRVDGVQLWSNPKLSV